MRSFSSSSAWVPTTTSGSPRSSRSASPWRRLAAVDPVIASTGTPAGAASRSSVAACWLRQDLGRGHERDLEPRLDRVQRGEQRDHGLAAADVAEQQPLHRTLGPHVGDDLGDRALLIGGERERQRLARTRGEPPGPAVTKPRPVSDRTRRRSASTRLEREQLLEHETAVRRGQTSSVSGKWICSSARARVSSPWARATVSGIGSTTLAATAIQRRAHDAAHDARRDPLGERVHRDQPADVEQLLDVALDHLEQRVHHLALDRIELAADHHASSAGQRAREERLAEEVAGRAWPVPSSIAAMKSVRPERVRVAAALRTAPLTVTRAPGSISRIETKRRASR